MAIDPVYAGAGKAAALERLRGHGFWKKHQITCSDLVSLRLPNARIVSCTEVMAGGNLPDHCVVTGVIEKEIHFEVKLPVFTEWNGNFLMLGNGGFAGSIQDNGYAGLERGYATAATDTGHVGNFLDASWALHNLKRQLNFGFRAVHLTAVIAKRIISSYYGKSPEYSIFYGLLPWRRPGHDGIATFPRGF